MNLHRRVSSNVVSVFVTVNRAPFCPLFIEQIRTIVEKDSGRKKTFARDRLCRTSAGGARKTRLARSLFAVCLSQIEPRLPPRHVCSRARRTILRNDDVFVNKSSLATSCTIVRATYDRWMCASVAAKIDDSRSLRWTSISFFRSRCGKFVTGAYSGYNCDNGVAPGRWRSENHRSGVERSLIRSWSGT